MKKLFVFAAALLALASCSQGDEPQAIVQTREICFAPAAQTRAVATAIVEDETTLETNGFSVWGYMMTDPLATVFEKVDVAYDNGIWSPSAAADVKYWSAGNDYWFSAMAPKSLENLYSFTTNGTDHQQTITGFEINVDATTPDLIVARPVSTQLGNNDETHTPVGLTFDHMLSRVKFTFTNKFADDNVTIYVSNVTLNGVLAKGDATIDEDGKASWSKNGDATKNVTFYETTTEVLASAAYEKMGETVYRYIIPQNDAVYSVSFHLEIKADNQTIATKDYTNIALNETDFVNGQGFVFNANIKEEIIEDELYPITFTVTVTDWKDNDPVDIEF